MAHRLASGPLARRHWPSAGPARLRVVKPTVKVEGDGTEHRLGEAPLVG